MELSYWLHLASSILYSEHIESNLLTKATLGTNESDRYGEVGV